MMRRLSLLLLFALNESLAFTCEFSQIRENRTKVVAAIRAMKNSPGYSAQLHVPVMRETEINPIIISGTVKMMNTISFSDSFRMFPPRTCAVSKSYH